MLFFITGATLYLFKLTKKCQFGHLYVKVASLEFIHFSAVCILSLKLLYNAFAQCCLISYCFVRLICFVFLHCLHTNSSPSRIVCYAIVSVHPSVDVQTRVFTSRAQLFSQSLQVTPTCDSTLRSQSLTFVFCHTENHSTLFIRVYSQ